MAELNLSFAVLRNKMCLRITEKGTSKRNYKQVDIPFLDFSRWNQKKQKFTGRSESSSRNNEALERIMSEYTKLNIDFKPSSANELFILHDDKKRVVVKPKKKWKNRYDYDEPVSAPNRSTTFSSYLRWLIYNMRHEKRMLPSRNYQTYVTLYNKLIEEGRVHKKHVCSITNKDFISFGEWMLSRGFSGPNFREMMKRFKSVHSKAYEHELNDNTLRYKFSADAPRRKNYDVYSLTLEQYRQLEELDVDRVQQRGPGARFLKQLYLDFCLFMYEMKIRPVDAFKLHSRNLIYDRGSHYIRYTPEKKKNYTINSEVVNKLTEKAMRIIRKYKGVSKMGYVFPFSVNDVEWDYEDCVSWNRWATQKQQIIYKINLFLKKAARCIGADFRRITVYSIRHSAFTHEISRNEKPLLQIAKEGGTSIDMLEKHYYHYIVS